MQHTLSRRLDAFRRRVSRQRWTCALLTAGNRLLAAAMLMVLIDYWLRYQDPGVRILNSLSFLALVVLVLRRRIASLIRRPLARLDLAWRLQRAFPVFGDRLTSAVEFLDVPDHDLAAGSAALRRAVIDEVAAAAADVPFEAALDRTPIRRAWWRFGLLAVVGVVAVALRPAEAAVGLTRLVCPWSAAVWPRSTHLAWRPEIRRMGRGQPFEIEVFDRRGRRLPDDVRIVYRQADGRVETEAARHVASDLFARRENIAQSFEFRVEGGDDHAQPWTSVEVVDLAEIDRLHVRLTPPPYTGWPPIVTPGHVRALAGTRMELEGHATSILRSATLRFDDRRTWPALIVAPSEFRLPLPESEPIVVRKSTGYGIDLTDAGGLVSTARQHYEIRAVEDAPPRVLVQQPAPETSVTTAATVLLRIEAEDDLALRAVTLLAEVEVDRGGRAPTPPAPMELFRRASPADRPAWTASGELPPAERRVIEHRWSLAAMGLSPGAQLSLVAEATDFRGGSSRSAPVRLSVVTPGDMLQQMAGRQSRLLSDLGRLVEAASRSRDEAKHVASQWAKEGKVTQAEVDQLRAAAIARQAMQGLLSDALPGLPAQARSVVEDLESNRLDQREMADCMRRLVEELSQVRRERTPPLEQEMTDALKAAELLAGALTRAADTRLGELLARADDHHAQLLQRLESIRSALAEWDSYRRFHRDLSNLLARQRELVAELAPLAGAVLGKRLSELPAQQRAALRRASQRQLDLAIELDQIHDALRRTAKSVGQNESAAVLLNAASNELDRFAVASTLRAAQAAIQQNRLAEANVGQREAMAQLAVVLDILAGSRRESGASAGAERPGDSAGESTGQSPRDAQELRAALKRIQWMQEELNRQTDELSRVPPGTAGVAGRYAELSRRQAELAELLERTMRGQVPTRTETRK